MHLPVKRDEGMTSLAGNNLSAVFEDTGLCAWCLSPESTPCLSSDSTATGTFFSTHPAARKAALLKRPDQGLLENLDKRLRPL